MTPCTLDFVLLVHSWVLDYLLCSHHVLNLEEMKIEKVNVVPTFINIIFLSEITIFILIKLAGISFFLKEVNLKKCILKVRPTGAPGWLCQGSMRLDLGMVTVICM